jgi:hypothetical protein
MTMKSAKVTFLLWLSRLLRVPVKVREEYYGVAKGCR